MVCADLTTTDSPQQGHLGWLCEILDNLNDTSLIDHLFRLRWRGRHGHPVRALWRAFIISYILNLGSTSELHRRLADDPNLRSVCGFPGHVPHRTTFVRFFTRLAKSKSPVVQCNVEVVNALRPWLPDLGDEVAIDSTAVRTHGNPRKRSDADAAWGVKTSSRSIKGSEEYHYGFKYHALADAKYGVLLGGILEPANKNDSPLLPTVMEHAKGLFSWFRPSAAMADRGYDAYSNFDYLDRNGTKPIIKIKQSPHGTLKEGIYTTDGVPTCIGRVPMRYIRSEDGRHLYRCVGCRLKDSKLGMTTHCDSEVWEDPRKNLRLFGPPSVRREGKVWKALYGKRQTIERTFKGMKQHRRLDKHCWMGLEKVGLHALLSGLVHAATVLANVRAGRKSEMLWMVPKVA